MQDAFTIAQTSELTAVPVHTLRYYERIGLIEPVAKDASGRRTYSRKDIEWIVFLGLFRSMGMSIQEMQRFTALKKGGINAAPERKNFLLQYREDLLKQIKKCHDIVELVDWKLDLLDEKILAGQQEIDRDTFDFIVEWRRQHSRRVVMTEVRDNKQVARRFAAAADAISAAKADWAAQEALVADDFRVYTGNNAKPLDFAGFREASGRLMAGFPGFRHHFKDQIQQGDKVANRIIWTGRHAGTFNNIAATHKIVSMTIFYVMRINADGKVSEMWRLADMKSLEQQIRG